MFKSLYSRNCVVCVWDSSFFRTPLGAAAIQVIENKWKNTILPTFLVRFIHRRCFKLVFMSKRHNLHYFLVCSWRGTRRAGISNKRLTKTCTGHGSRSGHRISTATGIQSSGGGEFLWQHSRFSELFCKLSLAKLWVRAALRVVSGAVTAGWQTLCLRGWSDCCLRCGRNIFPRYSLIILVAQSPAVLLPIFSFIIETPNTLWSISAHSLCVKPCKKV